MRKINTKEWLKTAAQTGVEEELFSSRARQLYNHYIKYSIFRTEPIKRKTDSKRYEVMVDGDICKLSQAHINSETVKDVIKEVSFNTTYRYVTVGRDDPDYDEFGPYSASPIAHTHNPFMRISCDRLTLERLDIVNNHVLCSFRIDSVGNEYLFVDYNGDSDSLTGIREIIAHGRQFKRFN
ncbi:hypothetical protein [Pontibacter sp. HSC-36F09]|uniref:hypothetical protein n=1 Tax=Pontibacter sp. HSC-36F09 TaxID=2910966 RepID=UPI0020A204D1|nr:hypothetical protein [Pontibacter sp. HSC-36F09]MCP2045049.1 hypothetical protein [Pontibacter sp. HSC-36F09]